MSRTLWYMTTTAGPGKAELDMYLRRGYTQRQIIEDWEEKTGERLKRSTLAMRISRWGLEPPNKRPTYQEMLPWTVARKHQMHPDARMLRLEAKRRRGLALTEEERRRLNYWLEDLKRTDSVIWYDREGGFLWVPRTEDCDDIIDRSNVEDIPEQRRPA